MRCYRVYYVWLSVQARHIEWSPKWWFAILKLLWQDGQLDSWLCTPRNVDWLDVMKLHLWLNTCMYIRQLACTNSENSWAYVGGCWNSVNEKGVDWSRSREVFSMQSFYNLGWRKDYWRMCVTNMLQLTSHTKLLDWWAYECWHALWYGKCFCTNLSHWMRMQLQQVNALKIWDDRGASSLCGGIIVW